MYTLVGSSGRGERAKQQVRQSGVQIRVKGNFKKRAIRALRIGVGIGQESLIIGRFTILVTKPGHRRIES